MFGIISKDDLLDADDDTTLKAVLNLKVALEDAA
jgi:hypothetical protein